MHFQPTSALAVSGIALYFCLYLVDMACNNTNKMTIKGFTLIEMMVVLLIVAILAAMAIPTFLPITARKQVNHALEIPEVYKRLIKSYYQMNRKFPDSNETVGMPESHLLISNTVRSVTLENGAMHIELGNRVIRELDGKIVSVQPLVVIGSPESPMDWACGYAAAPEGMEKAGENRTDIDRRYAPAACR